MRNILIIGAGGQIGTELTTFLRDKAHTLVISDIKPLQAEGTIYEELDVRDKQKLEEIIKKYKINEIYNMAALLSATGEQKPKLAWDINMNGLINSLDLAKEYNIKLFWPSSIAVFGPTTPKEQTPQHTIMEPTTMYGITKLAGERLCEYYNLKYGVDVRSVRYPGLISYKALPGGGTTDYAVEIFYEAIKHKKYVCFLAEDQELPMMFMDDAIAGTVQIMENPPENIKIRSSYNIAAFSFTPKQLAEEIRKYIPEFEIEYKPDFRQKVAETWPHSIDDTPARKHWNWKPKYSFEETVKIMYEEIKKKLTSEVI